MSGRRDQAHSGSAPARHSGADLTVFQAIAESVTTDGGERVKQVSVLIDQAQAFAATQVNAALTLRNWHIGRMIDVEVLKQGRAGYGQSSLYRMIKLSRAFPDIEIVAATSPKLGWSHFREIVTLPHATLPPKSVLQAVGRRRSGSPGGSSDVRRMKTFMSRDRRALNAALPAASRGF